MTLHVLPTRTAGAAENMATDFLLLQRYPTPGAPRFRHYDWRGPAVTFGYAQKISFVREKLAAAIAESDGRLELCRRATGGGVVDHRDDWTYALVLPRGHPLEEMRASQSYRLVHEALAAALRDQGVPAVTKLAPENPTPEAGAAPRADVCFDRAEVYDVIHETSAAKIAGAAQKRNKNGLLLQGSIWRPCAGAAVDWDAFGENFLGRLAEALGGPAEPVPWPGFQEEEVSALIDQYASAEWNEFR
jgi:lipoate-protein ligase A